MITKKKFPGLLFAIMMALLIFGCSDSDRISDANLIGNWKVVKYDYNSINVPHYVEFKQGGIYYENMKVLDVFVEYDGTWLLDQEKEIVKVNKQGDVTDLVITEFTKTEFKYKDSDGKIWELKKQ